MRRALISAIAITSLNVSAWATDGNIVLVFDPDASTCQATVPCRCTATLYVYGLLAGASANGFIVAEYKVATGPDSNADPGWLFAESFDPGAIVIGAGAFTPADPLPRGVDVAWPTCQQGDGYKVLIETVRVTAVDCQLSIDELQLHVVKHDSPSNQFFQCPLFALCDAPVYTKVCLGSNLTACPNPEPPHANDATCSTSGLAWLNPIPTRLCTTTPGPIDIDCPVAALPETWSGVKGLYRD